MECCINTEHFLDKGYWFRQLSDVQKKKLNAITYREIAAFSMKLEMTDVENSIIKYMQENDIEERIYGAVIIDEKNINFPLKEGFRYLSKSYSLAYKHCYAIYSIKAEKILQKTFNNYKRFNGEICQLHIDEHLLLEGCAYKTRKMIELSSRLGEPKVLKVLDVDESNTTNDSHSALLQNCTEKAALIDKIQPYGYFVEANINCNNEIKMSLNQVIETNTKSEEPEKSTLSICDDGFKIADIYESTSENIWEIVKQCTMYDSSSMELNQYTDFKANLTSIAKEVVSVTGILLIIKCNIKL